ncbi:MAG: hypothetical protein ACYTEP_04870 [Planctomycetota bacterium]|jgi:hypothetical protein
MGRVSVILLFPLLMGCTSAVVTDSWGKQSQRLGQALELSGATLQAKAAAPFAPDSPEGLSVRLTGLEIADAFARQVVSWKALDAYAVDMQRILDSRLLEGERVREVARAFHDLHRRLLQSGIAAKLGLSVERHREVVQEILACRSTVAALEAAQPAIGVLCQNLAGACQELEAELDRWLDTCLRNIDSKWNRDLDGYAVLLARKRDLEQEIAAQAAGITDRRGDPEGELLKLETLVRNSAEWRRLYAEEQENLALAFADARGHVQKTAHAVLEWGIAHREVTKAMRSGTEDVNLRLLTASAEELAPETAR